MGKIQKISSYLLFVFNSLLIMVPAFLALQWLLVSPEVSASYGINLSVGLDRMVSTPEGYVNLSTLPWTPALKLFGFFCRFDRRSAVLAEPVSAKKIVLSL